MKINHISPLEHNFTKVLGSIVLKPKMLFYYGKLPEKMPVVAIVGARKSTSYGQEIAFQAGYELARRGVAIVSGLAEGIDGAAHRGALAAGGVTVGVLGTAIDQIYPNKHRKLAEEMTIKGAVMSEYGPGEATFRSSFLARNRLIAGLAQVVLVVEAGERSGSLNTAGQAIEMGRELFAVPGDIFRPQSKGCNRLIGKGATPYLSYEDILEVLFPEKKLGRGRRRREKGETEEEELVLRLIEEGVKEGEEIISRLGMEAALFNLTITTLELKGMVRSLGMNRWSLG